MWWGSVSRPQGPAGHGETLGKAVDDERALFHAGIAQHGDEPVAVDDAGVNLIGENEEIMLDGEIRDAALDSVGVNGSSGIAGRVGGDDFRARRDFRGNSGGIGLEAIAFGKLKRHRNSTETQRDRWIGGKAGVRVKDLVT